ncbi:MAG: septal ring lytic transglycosylase RlpA family protein [Methylothermaceae bacterium]|nr:septal ring lytic transglycosylase RlpA family protein [Methylothermaceae bacterium]
MRGMSKGWLAVAFLLIGGCSLEPKDGPPLEPVDVNRIPDAVPRFEPRSRVANPDSYEVLGHTYRVMKTSRGYLERGIASWYGKKFHDHPTASGEPYDMFAMTAAHRTLPIPSYVRVTHLQNGRSVVVKVNDRGPFHSDRIIDLSYAAAVKLGLDKTGTARVEVRAVEPDPDSAGNHGVYLQVGAFSDPGNAQRLLARLAIPRFPKPSLHPVKQNNGTLYRVRIGPLASQAQVDALSRQLETLGITPSLVVNN